MIRSYINMSVPKHLGVNLVQGYAMIRFRVIVRIRKMTGNHNTWSSLQNNMCVKGKIQNDEQRFKKNLNIWKQQLTLFLYFNSQSGTSFQQHVDDITSSTHPSSFKQASRSYAGKVQQTPRLKAELEAVNESGNKSACKCNQFLMNLIYYLYFLIFFTHYV